MNKLMETFTDSKIAQLYAGLLYMINPYTYIRIVVGHWLILFAYAILPLAIKYFIELLNKKKLKSIIKFSLITTLVAFNAHTLFIAFLIFLIVLAFYIYKNKSLEILKPIILSSIIFLILNTYWLIPTITAEKQSIVVNISKADLYVFAPHIESFSALFTLASMHGFWRPAYIYAKDFLPFWPILFIFILFLAVHGFTSYCNNKKLGIYVKAFTLIWFIGLILASGILSPFSEIFEFLFNHILLFKGMRDTHKFVTMLCLSYSFLGALGLAEIEKSLKNKKPIIKNALILAILLIPLIYSFTFFNGFAHQIKPTDFPKDWYEVNEFLNKDKDDFRVLFFPWHLYMDFHWVPNKDKRIANPAPYFFDKEVISAKNIEVPGIYRQVYTPYQVYIDNLLSKKDKIKNFGHLVTPLGIKYILLTKEADYKNYFFLFNQSDLKLIMETKNFYVFKNEAFKGLIYSVNSSNWNLTNEKIDERDYKKLNYTKVSPVEYIIKDKPLRYIIFTEEYSKDWKFNGKEPLKAYGVVNAYKYDDEKEMKIVYERFYKICLPSYIISLLAFILCMGYLVKDKVLNHGR
ncbi:hypothetical protein J422_03463 [Methanocaldococcus villosus KIN24-T80]|uniref:Membrane protein 6-pyruvoyl-tetrahydropterin synthase-related domain-containing protein n=2 Tax=Methanocaldococcus villosus TaxID=667126 RepID=N6V1Q8_9EURY|nr:hypothetical protein J422_03463 [Methanocaldococcus villosus KIN24-T80]